MVEEGGARVSGDDWILTVNLFLVYHTEAAWILNHDVNNDSDEDGDCVEGYIRNENRLFFQTGRKFDSDYTSHFIHTGWFVLLLHL